MFKRHLNLRLPPRQSAFLWGARQTGKSTYLSSCFPDSVTYNLLKSDVFLAFIRHPSLLREQVEAMSPEQLALPIILDEVQKVPLLLDEVHWLIENTQAHFILCGSSARKLKRSGANLLGGRAWRYQLFPLLVQEISDFDLLKALNTGLIPSHYLSLQPQKSLEAYIADYLIQEIKEESEVRNLANFARFLDSMGFHHSELIKYTNIARDCGVDAKTVQNYFQILVDTLLGYFVLPYAETVTRDILRETPKFYLFDVGVANYLARRTVGALKGSEAGKSFEHLIFMELIAYKNMTDKRVDLTYWRTKTGLEVDFILGKAELAIEVKISSHVERNDIKGLIAFCHEHPSAQGIVVSQDPQPRRLNISDTIKIDILPWRVFLEKLWKEHYALY